MILKTAMLCENSISKSSCVSAGRGPCDKSQNCIFVEPSFKLNYAGTSLGPCADTRQCCFPRGFIKNELCGLRPGLIWRISKSLFCVSSSSKQSQAGVGLGHMANLEIVVLRGRSSTSSHVGVGPGPYGKSGCLFRKRFTKIELCGRWHGPIIYYRLA